MFSHETVEDTRCSHVQPKRSFLRAFTQRRLPSFVVDNERTGFVSRSASLPQKDENPTSVEVYVLRGSILIRLLQSLIKDGIINSTKISIQIPLLRDIVHPLQNVPTYISHA